MEDEPLLLRLLVASLVEAGVEARGVSDVESAFACLEAFDPHAVVTDLDLGDGPSGAVLLAHLAEERGYVALLALTAHAAPELVAEDAATARLLRERVLYVSKSSVTGPADLLRLVSQAIDGRTGVVQSLGPQPVAVVSPSQAELLRLIAAGWTNEEIAARRGTSLRAVEAMVRRTFAAVGASASPDRSARVHAARAWFRHDVSVRAPRASSAKDSSSYPH